MKIRFRHFLSLIIPLIALSGCSYHGSTKAIQDGDLLVRGTYENHIDTFETVDHHIKLGHPFCLLVTMEGCQECAKLEEYFPSINEDNKLLTLHLEFKEGSDDAFRFFEAYPEAQPEYLPSLIVAEGTNFNILSFEQINSKLRLTNNLKKTVSLANRYYVRNSNVLDVLNKTGLDNAALILFNGNNESHVEKYKNKLPTIEGPLIIVDSPGQPTFNYNDKIIL